LILRALSASPDDGYILDSLGWVYYKMGRHKKALDTLLGAARRVPADPVIQEHLGDVYLKLGQKQKASAAYRKAIQFDQSGAKEIRAKLDAIR
jgi:Flp pilus assembly protein TadD